MRELCHGLVDAYRTGAYALQRVVRGRAPNPAPSQTRLDLMKLMSTGAAAALVLGILTLPACAGGSTTAPVKTTASHTTHEAAPSPAPAPEQPTLTEAQQPTGVQPPPAPAPFEPEPDAVAANGEDEDVEPAEEIESSPLDEIPSEVPPATDAELQR